MGSGGTEVSFNGGMPQGWRDDPIDGEWLESVGFERRELRSGKVYWYRGLMSFYKHVEFCACPLPHITTKQHMLDAMDVLLKTVFKIHEADSCGNKWYPFDVARHWSIGVPVVVRTKSRETGLWMYSVASRWQGSGVNSFGESASFMMLERFDGES